ncbi:MAG TPA: helix-turn-helix domain-containing protein [Candidatus Nitrosotalea sp.]|nr:helix-turn-helix domain-containing protein [Candidatus Nitrosotalea sp.]
MALLDLLGRRWALRVIWELRAGRLTFRALQEACGGVSPTVLNERLRDLRESGLVDATGADRYGLTPLGLDLIDQFLSLVAWPTRWAAAVTRGRGTPRSSR